MASFLYTHNVKPAINDPIEAKINETFNRIIDLVNKRREEIISELRHKQEIRRNTTTSQFDRLQQLADMKADMAKRDLDDSLHELQSKMIENIEQKIMEVQVVEKEMEIGFQCDVKQLEEAISKLGAFIEKDITIPNYDALLQPSISVGEEGTAERELRWPGGLAFDEKSQLIYVGNGGCAGFGTGRISVFTMKGEYIDSFCNGLFNEPIGVSIHGDELFVTDSHLHCIFKLKLPSFNLVKKVGSNGSGINEFESLQKVFVDCDGSVFVADCGNNRVVVLSNDLEHKQYIQHESMKFPCDVKVNEDRVYILSFTDDPCLHVFSQSGEKMYSLISCGVDAHTQIKQSFSFCFDRKQNIIFGDNTANSIKVFSEAGEIVSTLGDKDMKTLMISPTSVHLTEDNRIICVSNNTTFALHIF